MESEAIIQSQRDLVCQQREKKNTEALDSFTYLGIELNKLGNGLMT